MNDDSFNSSPRVKRSKLNVLPSNPEEAGCGAVRTGRFPSWLHRPMPKGAALPQTRQAIEGRRLYTVCEEAKCPNRLECWSRHTATFLVLGRECTRSCGFCEIAFNKSPCPPDLEEPKMVADSVEALGLKHVVITMVARDDLEDGGAGHLCSIVEEVRKKNKQATVELLTSDFAGNKEAWQKVLSFYPEIFNHNVETVRSLTPRVRHKAMYERSLELLAFAKEHAKKNENGKRMLVKSGIMVGFGETVKEVEQTLIDLAAAGCDIVTIGQYLQPSRQKLLVKQFVPPELFDHYASFGRSLGIEHLYSSPFMRSSYNAAQVFTPAS